MMRTPRPFRWVEASKVRHAIPAEATPRHGVEGIPQRVTPTTRRPAMSALPCAPEPAAGVGVPRSPAPAASQNDPGTYHFPAPAVPPWEPGAAPAAAHSISSMWGADTVAGQLAPPVTVSAGWLPAPYSLLLHYVPSAAMVHGKGADAITGALCDRAATANPTARGRPSVWGYWPRCPDCIDLSTAE